MIDLKKLNLKFIGYWDCCFFTNNTKDSGLIVEDKEGRQQALSWYQLNKLMKTVK